MFSSKKSRESVKPLNTATTKRGGFPRLIIVIPLIALAFVLCGYAEISHSQSRRIDAPVVSDEPVKKPDSLRVVDKDEHQRIVNKLVDRIQKLENRIAALEIEIKDLRAEMGD